MSDIGGSDRPAGPQMKLFGRQVPIPRSRIARISIGVLLVFLGCLGFLPVLGFWMIPLGLFVLSYDFPRVRRLRRRAEVWWGNRYGSRARARR
jgi:hypothetical protein